MARKIKVFLLLFILMGAGIARAQSSETALVSDNIIGTRLLSINRTHNFLVIDIGTEEGISDGVNLNLLKDGKNIVILQVIRAKERVSACDIKHLEPNVVLKEGDIFSATIVMPASKKRVITQKSTERTGESIPKKSASAKSKKSREKTLPFISVLPMMLHIESRKEIVNYYLNETLREMNFIVTSVNNKEGIFTAHKFLPLPLWQELWADFKGTTDYRAVYDINTIDDESGTTLKLDIRLIYTNRAGRTVERSVWQGSQAVKDALELVKRVKNQSEILTRER